MDKIFSFIESNENGIYSAEIKTLPSFGDKQYGCKTTLDMNWESNAERQSKDANYFQRTKEQGISEMFQDFFIAITKNN